MFILNINLAVLILAAFIIAEINPTGIGNLPAQWVLHTVWFVL